MLEIGEHVAACGHVVVHAAHHRLSLFAAVLRLAIAIVDEVGGKDVRRYSLLGFGNAEGAIVLFQTSENIIWKPGFVAKFKRYLNGLRQSADEQFGHAAKLYLPATLEPARRRLRLSRRLSARLRCHLQSGRNGLRFAGADSCELG